MSGHTRYNMSGQRYHFEGVNEGPNADVTMAPSIVILVSVCVLCLVCAIVQAACYSRWLREGLNRFREPLVEGESVHTWAREVQPTINT